MCVRLLLNDDGGFLRSREERAEVVERASQWPLSTVIVVGFSAARRRRGWRCHDNLPGGHYFDGIGGRRSEAAAGTDGQSDGRIALRVFVTGKLLPG